MSDANFEQTLVTLTANVASAFLSNNTVSLDQIPKVVDETHKALKRLASPDVPETPAATPAVSIKKSVQEDYLVCLEDGRRFKSLKRHLKTKYNLTPDEYRRKWSLPADYPMVAPGYAKRRSELARGMGLGQIRQRSAAG
ncbi:MucR family transcriptional regulator [Microvirga tunisiensis]|uniref:MucR family transcriptional regulator n=1 Tax=Microvirga tunisiensis TaxID=2108360 RepID=A0A5N7MA66_9HYPH|nr:MucR family transcriptional regulator [Microvirga tunisiensis]MPR23811.1 MucR family transcriptional regulator [Microvirga tunisiensis]